MSKPNDFDRQLRGEPDPRELARRAIDAAAKNGDAAALRQRIAADAGLPDGLADRLRGDDAGALAADAAALAKDLKLAADGPSKPPTMDELIFGTRGESETDPEQPLPATTFDGGARGSTSTPAPSIDSLIRGAQIERSERIVSTALDLDHQNR